MKVHHAELSVKELVEAFLSVLQFWVKPLNTNFTGMYFLSFFNRYYLEMRNVTLRPLGTIYLRAQT